MILSYFSSYHAGSPVALAPTIPSSFQFGYTLNGYDKGGSIFIWERSAFSAPYKSMKSDLAFLCEATNITV